MRSQILYVPAGIILNLDQADLGHPDGRDIIERHYQQGHRPNPEFNRDNPAFHCLKHVDGTNPGQYLKKIRGEWWAVHYEAGDCPSHRISAPMSDEHKYQTEYWARAAEDVGWRVELEHLLHTGTRPDALIYGRVKTGIEVQRSAMTRAGAVARTRKALLAGVSDVWFTDREQAPLWAYRVPTVSENTIPWTTLPPRRAATATGLRVIRSVRCTPVTFARCPVRGRHCWKNHPRDEPWIGITVDDVAARFPAGEIVPMRFRRNSRSDDVLLVSLASLALYEDLTGCRAALSFQPGSEDRAPTGATGAVECANVQPAALPVGEQLAERHESTQAGRQRELCDVPTCTLPGRPYAQGRRCEQHRPVPVNWTR